MEDFIAIGKDVNESDEEGRTPLHYAVAYNHAEIVDELVASGANLEAQVQLQYLCRNIIPTFNLRATTTLYHNLWNIDCTLRTECSGAQHNGMAICIYSASRWKAQHHGAQ